MSRNTTRESLVMDAWFKRFPHVTQADCRLALDEMFKAITLHVKKGDTVELRGVGTFRLHHAASRPGRNVSTGEAVRIPKHKTVKVKFPKNFLQGEER